MQWPRGIGATLALSIASLAGCGGGDDSDAASAPAFAPPTVQLANPAQPNAVIAHVRSGHVPSNATPSASPTLMSAGVAPTHAELRRPTIVLEFDRPIAPHSVGGVALYSEDRASIAVGELSWVSDRQLAFAPLTPLKANRRYEIVVPTGIESTTGERSTDRLAAVFDTAPTSPPRGLANLGNTCFINTALQLAVHSTVLDDIVSDENVDPAVRTLLDRYDAASATELDKQLHTAITALRALPQFKNGGPGHVSDVIAALRMPLHQAVDADSILHAPPNAKAFQLNAALNYAALPNHDRLVAFSFNTPGHYIAFVKRDAAWYRVDDDKVTEVTEQDLFTVPPYHRDPKGGMRDVLAIEFAIYR
ncbi:peptidase [Burkholderia ubonensis]|nr:peptidase [Burkholderia ubonensis]